MGDNSSTSEAVIKKYDGGEAAAADERSKEEAKITSSSMFLSYDNPCYYLEVVLRSFLSCLGLKRSSEDPESSSSSSSSSEEEKEESKETSTTDDPAPPTSTSTEAEQETTDDVEAPFLLSAGTGRAVRRPPRPPVGTGRPPQHN
ncbi:hypothetical protein MKW94_025466 [Papaver nudicaule]|uniref:Uncharacterized protein n=1 Tax=Papaver nudicaule TaxID=74823 RepID=A0AA41SB66_PAPNU|nr:hypothetical protein [Papaver nudicaule]